MLAESLALKLQRAFRGVYAFDLKHALYAAPECRCRQCRITAIALAFYGQRVTYD